MRRLPGPAVWRLSEGDQTPEALYELFRDWQRTQTQSSVRTLRSLRQQMDVRSCGMQGPPAERQLLRVRKTLIDKGLRLATIGVKAAGVCCTCASAPLSGFAPTPVQHTGQLCLLPAAKNQTRQWALSERAQRNLVPSP